MPQEMPMRSPSPIVVIVGPPAVGKSTTSRALAAEFPKSVHIPVDDLRMMVVSGLVLPSESWSDELTAQLRIARSNATHMALTYRRAGYAVMIDDFWDPNHEADYAALTTQPQVHKIVLFPHQEAAHHRNSDRSGDSPARAYIDEGIRIVYQQLSGVIQGLTEVGWVVVDTTDMSVREVVAAIRGQATL